MPFGGYRIFSAYLLIIYVKLQEALSNFVNVTI